MTMSMIHGKSSPAMLEVWSDYARKHAAIEAGIEKSERTNSFNVDYKGIPMTESHRKELREILINKGSISFRDFDLVINLSK
jgi:hypothetical protein